jgi:hypothetical protein
LDDRKDRKNRGRIGRDEVDEYQKVTSTSYHRHAWYCELDGEPQLWQHYHHGAVQSGVFPMVPDMEPYVPSATTATIRIQEDEEYQCICRPSFDPFASASSWAPEVLTSMTTKTASTASSINSFWRFLMKVGPRHLLRPHCYARRQAILSEMRPKRPARGRYAPTRTPLAFGGWARRWEVTGPRSCREQAWAI